jgi:hypothetical protein
MRSYHFKPKLHKRRLLTHREYHVYTVNGFTVRNVAKPDEEFGHFATQEDFPDLIPKGEIWISQKLAAEEGIFFTANALTQLKRQADGALEDTAYDDGLEVERLLREKPNGVTFRDGKLHKQIPADIYLDFYVTLPDIHEPVEVWLVDGNLVRSYYKTDYTEGGHGYVYPWVHKQQIWVEDGVDHRELAYITCHEYLERRLMRDAGMEYDPAHDVCSAVEFDLRKNEHVKLFLAPGRRKIRTGDPPRLASQELFEYVLAHYVKQ